MRAVPSPMPNAGPATDRRPGTQRQRQHSAGLGRERRGLDSDRRDLGARAGMFGDLPEPGRRSPNDSRHPKPQGASDLCDLLGGEGLVKPVLAISPMKETSAAVNVGLEPDELAHSGIKNLAALAMPDPSVQPTADDALLYFESSCELLPKVLHDLNAGRGTAVHPKGVTAFKA